MKTRPALALTFAAVLFCSATATARAQTAEASSSGAVNHIRLRGVTPGRVYYLRVVAAAAGEAPAVELFKAAELSVDGGDDPGPDPDPPGDSFGLAPIIAAELGKLDNQAKQSATDLAGLYLIVARQLDAKTKTPQQAATDVGKLIDGLLDSRKQLDDWKPLRAALKTKLDALSKSGAIRTHEETAAAFREISAALAAGRAIDWTKLIAAILELLNGGGPADFIGLLIQILLELFSNAQAGRLQ